MYKLEPRFRSWPMLWGNHVRKFCQHAEAYKSPTSTKPAPTQCVPFLHAQRLLPAAAEQQPISQNCINSF